MSERDSYPEKNQIAAPFPGPGAVGSHVRSVRSGGVIQDRTSVALSEGADPKTDFIFNRVFSAEFRKPLLAALPHHLL